MLLKPNKPPAIGRLLGIFKKVDSRINFFATKTL